MEKTRKKTKETKQHIERKERKGVQLQIEIGTILEEMGN